MTDAQGPSSQVDDLAGEPVQHLVGLVLQVLAGSVEEHRHLLTTA